VSQETPPAPTRAERAGEEDIPGARMAALTAYLETHRAAFTESALRGAALEAGYSDAELDAALLRLAQGAPGSDPGRRPVRGLTAAATFIVAIVVVWLGLSALETAGRAIDPSLPVPLIGWLAAGILGAILWWWSRERHPSLARGVATAVIVVTFLPVVLFLVVFGICVVTGAVPMSL
jgi:hypothetical protein